MKFVQHFSWYSSKCCNKLHLKLFSFIEIPYPLYEYENEENFMLFKFGRYKFYLQGLHFRKNKTCNKKTN